LRVTTTFTDPGGGVKPAEESELTGFSTGGVDGFEDLDEHPKTMEKENRIIRDKTATSLKNRHITDLVKG
jgi:hypothetical protein